MPSLVIVGGLIVDGTGAEPYRADVAIEDDRITAVGSVAAGDIAMDATDLYVSPGFIDVHTHSDFTIPGNPGGRHAVRQGVTTEVIGNCGFSLGPVSDEFGSAYADLVAPFGDNLDWSWRSSADALAALVDARPVQNLVPLVGHGTIRTAIAGLDGGTLTDEARRQMASASGEAARSGYWGISTGLIYSPGVDSDEDEIVQTARSFAPMNGLYATHMRDEADHVLQSVEESVRTAKSAGLRLQVSHLKSVGRRNWGRVAEALEIIDAARGEGLDVSVDFYPYEAISTFLGSLLPPWVHRGGVSELVARLASPDVRARLRVEIESPHDDWWNPYLLAEDWDRILIAAVTNPKNHGLEGKSVSDVARERAVDPFDLVCDVLIEENGGALMAAFVASPDDLDRLATYQYAAVGSDSVGVRSPGQRAHPRAYGSFTRFLSEYVRKRSMLTWGEGIRRITGLPARIVGLHGRGVIGPGAFADLVMFDPTKIEDRATYADPDQPPVGIHSVMIGGREVYRDGSTSEERPGRVLRRSAAGA